MLIVDLFLMFEIFDKDKKIEKYNIQVEMC